MSSSLSRAAHATHDIAQLKTAFDGNIILPNDAAYENARHIHNSLTDAHPTVIVQPKTAQDVAVAVQYAMDADLRIAVRGGGHNNGGFGTVQDGIVVDLSAMREVRIDAEARVAIVEGGATAGDVTSAAMEHGLIVPFGDSPSVGVGGITLGGGVGWLTRKLGMTIDSLLAVEIVTADGSILRASETENRDLFWAVRGGGGNFGVVTRFEFRLHPIETVLGGMLILPATRGVIREVIDLSLEAPDDLTMISMVGPMMPMPGVPEELYGQMAFTVMLVWAGELESGEQALAPFRALVTPLADMVGPISFTTMYGDTAAPVERYSSVTRAFMAGRLDDAAIDAMLAAVAPEGRPKSQSMNVIQVRVLGGAMARVPADATAFAHRAAPLLVALAAIGFEPAALEEQRKWVDSGFAAMRHTSTGSYLNFLENEGEHRIREAYPEATYQRLANVKRQYDPNNVFRLNQNIQPTKA